MEPRNLDSTTIRTVTLTEQEKAMHRAALLHAFHERPAIVSPYQQFIHSIFSARHLAIKIVALVLIILSASGGTLAYASESALPGDVLYPVKIHVAEAIEVSLAPTTAAKALIQKTQIQTRLQEIITLKDTDSLTQAKADQVKSALAEHITDLKATVASLPVSQQQAVTQTITTDLSQSVAELNAPITSSEGTSETVTTEAADTTSPAPKDDAQSMVSTFPPTSTSTPATITADNLTTTPTDATTTPSAIAATGVSATVELDSITTTTVDAVDQATANAPVDENSGTSETIVSPDATTTPAAISTDDSTTTPSNIQIGPTDATSTISNIHS